MQGTQTLDPQIEIKHCKYIFIKYIYLYVTVTQTQHIAYISHLVTTIILSQYFRIQYKQNFIHFLKTQVAAIYNKP